MDIVFDNLVEGNLVIEIDRSSPHINSELLTIINYNPMKNFSLIRFRFFIPVLMILSFVFSCSEESLEEIEQDHIDLSADNAIYNEESCSNCIAFESGEYYVESGWATGNAGPNVKKVGYSVFNTEDEFVVEATFEITEGNAKTKSTIAIHIGEEEKIFKNVESGTTVSHSIVLPAGWESCDEVSYFIRQNGLSKPIEFSGVYDLIPVCTSGTADFSTFVALGNSLTTGYSDGTVFLESQYNSLPNILSGQFALAGGGEFTQPLVNDNIGGLLFYGTEILEPRLIFDGQTIRRLDATPTTEVTNILTGPFNNLGVPDAKGFHLLAPGFGNAEGVMTGQANPYFVRFASSPGTTVLQDALAQEPTFFSLWAGIMDVEAYATTGGVGINQQGNLDPSTYSRNDLTDPDVFAHAYSTLVENLTANGAKGVVANIPNITSLPYFFVVPFNPLDPNNPNFGPQIPGLNETFGMLNQVFAALGVPERSIVFSSDDASALVIEDESLQDLSEEITAALIGGGLDAGTAQIFGYLYGQARQANENDLIMYPSASVIGELNSDAMDNLMSLGLDAETAGQLAVNGITFPLEDQWVLLPHEKQEVMEATVSFNEIIRTIAEQKGLALVDINQIFDEVASTGVVFDGFYMNAELITGGAVSLDGLHPTARGYAYLANQFLKAINTNYGSNLPPVKADDYPILYSPSYQDVEQM